LQCLAADFERQLPFLGVNGDGVAVLHERNRPADVGFGRDAADRQVGRSALPLSSPRFGISAVGFVFDFPAMRRG